MDDKSNCPLASASIDKQFRIGAAAAAEGCKGGEGEGTSQYFTHTNTHEQKKKEGRGTFLEVAGRNRHFFFV